MALMAILVVQLLGAVANCTAVIGGASNNFIHLDLYL